MTTATRTSMANAMCLAVFAGGLTVANTMLAPAATAQNCGPGFVRNPYSAQCLAPVVTPTINGVPCVPSNLGLCRSFLQNQQPPRRP